MRSLGGSKREGNIQGRGGGDAAVQAAIMGAAGTAGLIFARPLLHCSAVFSIKTTFWVPRPCLCGCVLTKVAALSIIEQLAMLVAM